MRAARRGTRGDCFSTWGLARSASVPWPTLRRIANVKIPAPYSSTRIATAIKTYTSSAAALNIYLGTLPIGTAST